MNILCIFTLVVVMTFSALSFFFRKPGPKGEKGDRGDDGNICDNLTYEKIIEILNEHEEIEMKNTILIVKDVRKNKTIKKGI